MGWGRDRELAEAYINTMIERLPVRGAQSTSWDNQRGVGIERYHGEHRIIDVDVTADQVFSTIYISGLPGDVYDEARRILENSFPGRAVNAVERNNVLELLHIVDGELTQIGVRRNDTTYHPRLQLQRAS